MSSHRGKETGSSSSISGSIPLRISTPIQSYGSPSTLCKQINLETTSCSCSYLISWSEFSCFSFLVDNTPIRVFKNAESVGVPFPKNQPMRIYSSLWNADDWATRGGLVKTDWSSAPFTAYYRNFYVQTGNSRFSNGAWQNQELDAYGRRRLRWVQKNFMIYNYCTDYRRFPQGFPLECRQWSLSVEGYMVLVHLCASDFSKFYFLFWSFTCSCRPCK